MFFPELKSQEFKHVTLSLKAIQVQLREQRLFQGCVPLGTQVLFFVLAVLVQSITLASCVSATNVGPCGFQHAPVHSSLLSAETLM